MNKPIISGHRISKSFNGVQVLHDIDFNIYPGKITVIAGASGSGKTTLARIILNLSKADSGDVKLFDIEMKHAEGDEFDKIMKRVGVLFQHGALLNSLSVHDNVAIPLKRHTDLPDKLISRICYAKLKLVGMEHTLYMKPSELSGGMKKRAALARAMALDPELLVFDEPSAGLDPQTSKEIDELLLYLKEKTNVTMLVISHELSSILRVADNFIFLEDGKIAAHGPLKEVLASDSISEAVERFFSSGSNVE
ncbi:ABC transporter ATP-binding protein [Spirochaeta dissipatitropha]